MQSWLTKHLVFSILKQFYDAHVHANGAFAALTDFKMLVGKAKTQSRFELQRAIHTRHGAKLLVSATAMKAHCNRHFGEEREGGEEGGNDEMVMHGVQMITMSGCKKLKKQTSWRRD